MKKILLSAVFAASMPLAASAADLYVPPPAAPIFAAPAFSWTGGYLGIQGGYQWNQADVSILGFPFGSGDVDGGIIGAYAGWNWQVDSIVYGIEANLNYSFAEANVVGPIDAEAGLQGNIRGRLGVAFDRLLLYGTAGVSIARAEVNGPAPFNDSDTSVGWTVGAGLEWAFADNASVRLDYTYANHDFSFDFGLPVTVDADVDSHTVMLGVAWKL